MEINSLVMILIVVMICNIFTFLCITWPVFDEDKENFDSILSKPLEFKWDPSWTYGHSTDRVYRRPSEIKMATIPASAKAVWAGQLISSGSTTWSNASASEEVYPWDDFLNNLLYEKYDFSLLTPLKLADTIVRAETQVQFDILNRMFKEWRWSSVPSARFNDYKKDTYVRPMAFVTYGDISTYKGTDTVLSFDQYIKIVKEGVKPVTTPQTLELTMAEVCDRLGKKVKIIK